MPKAYVITLLVLFLQTGFYLRAGNNYEDEDDLSKDVLFVIKHCKSPNMVVYKANRTVHKELNHSKPVDVFWLMNTKGKTIENLTFLEWKMAFGYKLKTIQKGKQYRISLHAIKERPIYISELKNGQVEGYMKIKGVFCKLKEVFVDFEYSLLGPIVNYVDLFGTDLKNGRKYTERVWNK